MDKRASLLTDEQKQTLWHDGYVIKKAELVDWDSKDSGIKVIEKKDVSTAFVTPDDSCKCEVLLNDGDTEEVTLLLAKKLPEKPRWGLKNLTPREYDEFYVSGQDEMKYYGGRMQFILKDGKAIRTKGAVTALKDSIEKLDKENIGAAFSEANPEGRGVLLVMPSGSCLFIGDSFRKAEDGSLYSYTMVIRESEDSKLRESISYDKVLEVPKGTRVLKADYYEGGDKPAYTSPVDLGRTIERFINRTGTKIKMTSDGQEVSFYGPASKPSDRFMEKEAAMHLVTSYGISPKDAKLMLKMAGAGSIGKPYATTFLLRKKAELEDDLNQKENEIAPADIGMTEITEEPPQITREDLQNKAMSDEETIDTIQKAT